MSDNNLPPVLDSPSDDESPYGGLKKILGDFSENFKGNIGELRDKTSSTLNQTKESFQDMLLGPFGQLSKSLTGISGSDLFKSAKGLFKRKDDNGKSTEGRVTPKDSSLLRFGALGAGFVYLARTLGGKGKAVPEEMGEEGGGFLSQMMGRLGIRGGGRALGGLAGKIGPLLAAAGPWVALAATIAGTAIAFKNEWDLEAESMGEEMRDVWQDENATFLQKVGVTLKNTGKGIFGALAGGVRGVVDGISERFSNVREIWADEERSTTSKVFGTLAEYGKGVIESGFNFVKGFGKTIFNGIVGLFPDDKQDAVRNVFSNVRKAVFGKDSRTAKELFNDMKGKVVGFMNMIGSGVRDFTDDVREKGLRRAVRDRVQGAVQRTQEFFSNVGESIGEFFSDVKEDGFGVTAESRINELFEGNDGIIANAARAVGNFFGDVQRDGFGAAISERVENLRGLIGGFFQSAGEAIGNFFNSLNDTVDAVNLQLEENRDRRSLIHALGGGTALTNANRDADAYDSLVDTYRAQMGMDDASHRDVRRAMEQDIGFLTSILQSRGIDPDSLDSGPSYGVTDAQREAALRRAGVGAGVSNPRSVDDAIITKDGQVINLHPDDNVLATQSNLGQMDNRTTLTTSERNSLRQPDYGSQLHSDLLQLIQALENKNFNVLTPAINTAGPKGFHEESLRFGTEG